jgi:hypothetical protein
MSPNGVVTNRRDAWNVAAVIGRGRRDTHAATTVVAIVSRKMRRFIGGIGCEWRSRAIVDRPLDRPDEGEERDQPEYD